MLTLSQHEPRFSIIREEVSTITCFHCHKMGHIAAECPLLHPDRAGTCFSAIFHLLSLFSDWNKPTEDEEEEEKKKDDVKFQWLHINVLREYLDAEFRALNLPFPYSLERAIDDFIVVCFLAGNDFLPRLPSVVSFPLHSSLGFLSLKPIHCCCLGDP